MTNYLFNNNKCCQIEQFFAKSGIEFMSRCPLFISRHQMAPNSVAETTFPFRRFTIRKRSVLLHHKPTIMVKRKERGKKFETWKNPRWTNFSFTPFFLRLVVFWWMIAEKYIFSLDFSLLPPPKLSFSFRIEFFFFIIITITIRSTFSLRFVLHA